jgi:hypothetical protein
MPLVLVYQDGDAALEMIGEELECWEALEQASLDDEDRHLLAPLLTLLKVFSDAGKLDASARHCIGSILTDCAKTSASVCGGLIKHPILFRSVVASWLATGELSEEQGGFASVCSPMLFVHRRFITENLESFRPLLTRLLGLLDVTRGMGFKAFNELPDTFQFHFRFAHC